MHSVDAKMTTKLQPLNWHNAEKTHTAKEIQIILTVACIIFCRFLISVHKWQSSGMADTHEYWSQHDAHLVYLPIFHGLNLIIFS